MNLANTIPSFLVGKLGLNLQGAMLLTVRGRKSGEPRSLVVNPLHLGGDMYLLSPRGETQWVKNLRATNTLTLGRGSTSSAYDALEITDPDVKLDVMRAYLDRWGWQVKNLMGVSTTSPDTDLQAISDKHPVFLLKRA